MADVFIYNSGSLFQALDPEKNLVPLTDEAFMANVDDYVQAVRVTSGGQVYGVAVRQAMGGGILYNKPIYDKLGLQVPKTWAEFMANNAKIKAAGIAPVIQTYGDTWTSQLFVLADFHNVAARSPDWADEVHGEPGEVRDEPGARGLPAPAGGPRSGLPEQELRLGRSSTQGLKQLWPPARARSTRC